MNARHVAELGLPPDDTVGWSTLLSRLPALRGHWDEPRTFAELGDDPNLAGVIPLLEENGESLYGYRTDRAQYGELDYETGEWTDIGPRADQLSGWLLVQLGESGLDDLLAPAAEALGFAYLNHVVAWLDEDDEDEDEDEALARLMAELGGGWSARVRRLTSRLRRAVRFSHRDE